MRRYLVAWRFRAIEIRCPMEAEVRRTIVPKTFGKKYNKERLVPLYGSVE
jgi:hypothetical protein